MKGLKEVADIILQAKRIAIFPHLNPDGDCIGSMLALGLGLISMGKEVAMVSSDGVPRNLKKLPGADKVKRRLNSIPQMCITVDCNSKEMIGKFYGLIKKAKYILEIDHHAYRRPFGNLSLIDVKASAVGEIVYRLLKYLKVNISREIAENILTSIIVETNSFRLPSLSPFTFIVCADLLKSKVDFARLSERVYWSKTKESVILSGLCMANLKIIEKGKIAWTILRKKDFLKVRGKSEDVDTVANDILSISSVKIAIFLREVNEKILRVSLRSKDRLNVVRIASRYGGGGHFDAAGCYIANQKEAINQILRDVKTLLRKSP